MGCDQQKTAIETNKEATKSAIDDQKKAVDVAAAEAKKVDGRGCGDRKS